MRPTGSWLRQCVRDTHFETLGAWRATHTVDDKDAETREVADDILVAVALGEMYDANVVYTPVSDKEMHLSLEDLPDTLALHSTPNEVLVHLVVLTDHPGDHCDLFVVVDETVDARGGLETGTISRRFQASAPSYDTLRDASGVDDYATPVSKYDSSKPGLRAARSVQRQWRFIIPLNFESGQDAVGWGPPRAQTTRNRYCRWG